MDTCVLTTMEQRIKNVLGEYAFTILALQHQIESLTKEIEELKQTKENK